MTNTNINQTLITHIQGGHGIETARAVQDFFEKMEMPIPQHGAFSISMDFGFLVFLNDAGCVLRLTTDAQERFDSRHILQPLISQKAGDMRIEIFPGVSSPTSAEDNDKLKRLLKQDGIDFLDDGAENCGYLPHVTDEHGKPVPVVIDPGAVFALSENVEEVQRHLPDDVQDKLYNPLKDAFNRAWPQEQGRPDSALVQAFWQKCREMKQQGLLRTGWLDISKDFKNIKRGSRLYAAHWHQTTRQPKQP